MPLYHLDLFSRFKNWSEIAECGPKTNMAASKQLASNSIKDYISVKNTLRMWAHGQRLLVGCTVNAHLTKKQLGRKKRASFSSYTEKRLGM